MIALTEVISFLGKNWQFFVRLLTQMGLTIVMVRFGRRKCKTGTEITVWKVRTKQMVGWIDEEGKFHPLG